MTHKGTLMVECNPFPACLSGTLLGIHLLWVSWGILCNQLPLGRLLLVRLHGPMVVMEEIDLMLLCQIPWHAFGILGVPLLVGYTVLRLAQIELPFLVLRKPLP
jgi:hypothetical protein